jgi:hypothetical protein
MAPRRLPQSRHDDRGPEVDQGSGHLSRTRIKKRERRWKVELIESVNPEWSGLYETPNQ